MINDTAEKCRGCTIKHLTTALIWVDATDHPEVLRIAYLCGHLAHAANHFIHYSPEIAESIRQLRLNSINDDLTLNIAANELKKELESIIAAVAAYKEPENPEVRTDASVKTMNKPKTSGGCGCRKK